MIMRNEEKLLQRCLDSVKGLVDEIVIVDTGSTDRSVEIAIANGARVFSDLWHDDYAVPRNKAIAEASKDWIFVLDPDEVIARKDHYKLRELTMAKGVDAFRMATRNYTQNSGMQGSVPNDNQYEEGRGWYGYTPSVKTRFFKRGSGLKFVGRWHELLDYSLDPRKHVVGCTDVPVHHYAHEINQKSIQEKKEYYLKLGEMKVVDDPGNDQAWWELGVAEGIMGYFPRAARSILMSFRNGFYTADRMFQLVFALNKIGMKKEADYYFEKAICFLYPNLTHYDEGLRKLPSFDPHLERKIV
jgi:glycosyltransferase involved in cell wall biosynthesis